MAISTLEDLLIHELRDLYSAEKQLIRALPKMAKTASSDALREGFELHLEETQGQVERLDKIFEILGKSSRGPKCEAMAGLVEEGKTLMEEDADPNVLDAGLICAAQKVEHYEIASYGCVRTFATLLGMQEIADLLQETLDEEQATDEKLSELAESEINVEAVQED